jgi:hypothetical protein
MEVNVCKYRTGEEEQCFERVVNHALCSLTRFILELISRYIQVWSIELSGFCCPIPREVSFALYEGVQERRTKSGT